MAQKRAIFPKQNRSKRAIFRQQNNLRPLHEPFGHRAKGNQRRNLRDLTVGVTPHCLISFHVKRQRRQGQQGRRQGWQRQGRQQGRRQGAAARTTATGAPADAKTRWIEIPNANPLVLTRSLDLLQLRRTSKMAPCEE